MTDGVDLVSIGRTHLAYHQWASARILDAVALLAEEQLYRDVQGSFGSLYGVLQHIYQVDSLWFSRIAGHPHLKLADAPAVASTSVLKRDWPVLLERFSAYMADRPEAAWLEPVTYVNSQGLEFHTPLWQILFQVVNHGTSHRGQMITILRQLGATPPNTDLITFYRERL